MLQHLPQKGPTNHQFYRHWIVFFFKETKKKTYFLLSKLNFKKNAFKYDYEQAKRTKYLKQNRPE